MSARGEAIESVGDILAEIDSARPDVREQFLQGNNLLLSLVAAIIDHDIEYRYPCLA